MKKEKLTASSCEDDEIRNTCAGKCAEMTMCNNAGLLIKIVHRRSRKSAGAHLHARKLARSSTAEGGPLTAKPDHACA